MDIQHISSKRLISDITLLAGFTEKDAKGCAALHNLKLMLDDEAEPKDNQAGSIYFADVERGRDYFVKANGSILAGPPESVTKQLGKDDIKNLFTMSKFDTNSLLGLALKEVHQRYLEKQKASEQTI